MLSYIVALATIVLLGIPKQSSAQVTTVDLRQGTSSPLVSGVTWHAPLIKPARNCLCNAQGVLKLTFALGVRVTLYANMTFENPEGVTFDLGDSSTNNGFAGDSGTQQNDAEVHSSDTGLNFYGRDDRVNGGSTGLLHSEPNFVGVNPYTTLTLEVKDGLLRAYNGFGLVHVQSPNLFQLQGQSDAGGVNYDLYLSLNRVPLTGSRTGVGLCSLSVRFSA